MTSSEGRCRALAIGPAAALELKAAADLRIHSVFASSVNLLSDDGLVTLAGPAGAGHPHAVVVAGPGDFRAWGLPGGGWARVRGETLGLPGVRIDLAGAERPPAPVLAGVPRLGGAHRACLAALARHQAATGCALALADPSGSAMGQALWRGVMDLIAAPDRAARDRAVAALVGLGPGLTPAGDDILCGFLAAAGPALAPGLAAAMAANLARTGLISARLMAGALRGFWPAPLAALAAALAGDDVTEALADLAQLCRLGHSSGADLATGYLLGLAAGRPGFPAHPGILGGFQSSLGILPPNPGRNPRNRHVAPSR